MTADPETVSMFQQVQQQQQSQLHHSQSNQSNQVSSSNSSQQKPEPGKAPSRAGACRVCLKSFKPEDFSKSCAECQQKVCEDCASYSKLDESEDAVSATIFFLPFSCEHIFRLGFIPYPNEHSLDSNRGYHSHSSKPMPLTLNIPSLQRFKNNSRGMYFLSLSLLHIYRYRGVVVFVDEKWLRAFACHKIPPIRCSMYQSWTPFSEDIPR